MIRVRLCHESEALMMGSVALQEEEERPLSPRALTEERP